MNKINRFLFGFGAVAMLPMLPGCDVAPDSTTAAASTADPSQVREDSSAFENGVNKTYLAYRGIDEATLLAELQAGKQSDSDVGDPNGIESSSQALTADELGFLNVPDMIQNPGKYFYASLEAVALPSPGIYANVGFNTQKLNDTLRLVNYPIKETTYNRYYIRNMSVSGVSSSAISLRGEIQVKHYERKPWPLSGIWLIFDKTGTVDLKINYTIDSATNTLTFSKITASNIQIATTIWQYLFSPVSVIVDSIVSLLNVSRDLNMAVPLRFLPSRYVQLTSISTNQLYIMFRLKLLTNNMYNDFINTLNSFGVGHN